MNHLETIPHPPPPTTDPLKSCLLRNLFLVQKGWLLLPYMNISGDSFPFLNFLNYESIIRHL